MYLINLQLVSKLLSLQQSPEKNCNINFPTPKQWFADLSVHRNHPGDLLKQNTGPHSQRFCYKRSEAGPSNLHFH